MKYLFRKGLRKYCRFLAAVVVGLYLVSACLQNCSRLATNSAVHFGRRFGASGANLPEVIIYRRSKKTGSSSMLEELLRETKAYGYVPLYHAGRRMREVVRAERLKRHPRRLFVAEHNAVTREETGTRETVIIDTMLDGYKQMTSHCRYVEKHKVPNCDMQLVDCLRGPARHQRFYRWAGRRVEDESTFIDIPLSSAHPALSTTALRHVFPNVVLNVKHRNSAGSACPEIPAIRSVYQRNYRELEGQIATLRNRLLSLGGYPIHSRGYNISSVEMLDAAETLERIRYRRDENLEFGNHRATNELATGHVDLKRQEKMWVRNNAGNAMLPGR